MNEPTWGTTMKEGLSIGDWVYCRLLPGTGKIVDITHVSGPTYTRTDVVVEFKDEYYRFKEDEVEGNSGIPNDPDNSKYIERFKNVRSWDLGWAHND